MVRNVLPVAYKDSSILTKRESGQLARNKILLTIAVTSGIWLILDIFLFYSSGFTSLQPEIDGVIKMPSDRRHVNKRRSFEVINDSMKMSTEIIKTVKPLKILSKLKNIRDKNEKHMEQVAEDHNESLDTIDSRIDQINKIKELKYERHHSMQQNRIELIPDQQVCPKLLLAAMVQRITCNLTLAYSV